MPQFIAKANLHSLHCITPTDVSGEDEPYIWTFFVRADGSTLLPNPANPGQFIPSLTIVAKPGEHGNLNVEGVVSGSNFKIPNKVGDFETELVPIPISFTFGSQTFEGWVPGRLVCLAAVVDEDATSDVIVAAIHLAVVKHVQTRVNQFFGGLNVLPAVTGAAANGIDAVTDAVNTFLTNQLEAFQRQLTSEITELAVDVALRETVRLLSPGAMLFTIVVNALDHDELVGVGNVPFAEDALIEANLFMNATADVRQPSSTLGGAWYVLRASAEADLRFFPSDFVWVPSTSKATSRVAGSHTPTRDMVCVPDGRIQFWRAFLPQSHDIMVTYPFCTYRYSINGKILEETLTEVTFPSEVLIEEFDETGYPFVKTRSETRTVRIRYKQQADVLQPQLRHLILENDPADGTYYFNLKIEALLPGGRTIVVGEQPLLFEGQVIEFEPGFIEGIKKCLEPFMTNKYAKSKHIGKRELWGARAYERQFEEVMGVIEERASMRAIAPGRLNSVRAAVERAFHR
jgi:hypothetical protein